MSNSKQEHYRKQRRHDFHNTNLQGSQPEKGEAAEILHTLSDITDLPIEPEDDPVMGQLVSTLTSTANLTAEEVRSNEWTRQWILILYLAQYPTEEGLTGPTRGWVYGDPDEEIDPMDPTKRAQLETFVMSSVLALTRSEDAKVIEEGTRNVNESIVTEEDGGSDGGGGILGRLKS